MDGLGIEINGVDWLYEPNCTGQEYPVECWLLAVKKAIAWRAANSRVCTNKPPPACTQTPLAVGEP